MSRFIAALAAPLVLLGASACTNCTEAGCTIEYEGSVFEFDEGLWASAPGGVYRFTVSYDGQALSCEAVVGGDVSCDSELLYLGGFSSGMGSYYYTGFDVLVLDAFPAEATLVVERDGELVFEETFTIEAETEYPNGEECGGGCRAWASGELAW